MDPKPVDLVRWARTIEGIGLESITSDDNVASTREMVTKATMAVEVSGGGADTADWGMRLPSPGESSGEEVTRCPRLRLVAIAFAVLFTCLISEIHWLTK
jgi:hypothetical protein